jgi:peptidyl-tRNA hydrolase, PTH2 family
MNMKQIFVINQELGMGKGKIGVQTAHAATLYMEEVMSQPHDSVMYQNYLNWKATEENPPIGLMKKIVYKASETEIRNITAHMQRFGIRTYLVFDKGLTQVEPNSLTCLALEPISDVQSKELFHDMKLL